MTMMMRTLALAVMMVLLVGAVAAAAKPADDKDPGCEEWADGGECDKNPGYMLVNCATSCSKVSDEAVEQELQGISSFFDLSFPDIDGNDFAFSNLRGKVTILTNVASYCGYTQSHYKELVELWSHVKDEAVEILAFPCNQFGKQEPGTAEEIKSFAAEKGVQFKMMSKTKVNGPSASKVYKFLKREAGPASIKWNFATYFVVGPDGQVTSYDGVTPMSLKSVALGLLKEEL